MISFDDVIVLSVSNKSFNFAIKVSQLLKVRVGFLITKDILYPGKNQVCVGAITEDATPILIDGINYSDPRILDEINETKIEIQQEQLERALQFSLPSINHQIVVLVEENSEDWLSILSAAKYARDRGARRVSVLMPKIMKGHLAQLNKYIDKMIHYPSISGMA